MLKIFFVFIGGGLGATLRYLITTFFAGRLGNFPLGTLTINIIGSFLMGVVVGILAGKSDVELYRVSIAIGFLGGFTTLSSFFVETLALVHAGQLIPLLISVFGNLVVAFFACIAGLKLAQFF